MVFWDVVNCEAVVFGKEIGHSWAFVPAGMINPEFDTDRFVPIQDGPKHAEEANRIAPFLFDHPMLSTQRVDPTENVETLVMLALGQNNGLGSPFAPDSAQLWMETKPCLVREQQHPFALTSLDRQEFFYRLPEFLYTIHGGLSVTVYGLAQRKP
jgi:hypothetical protein